MKAQPVKIALLILFFITSCAHKPSVPEFFAAQNAIDRYISSGQYEAECRKVAEQATAYLQQRIEKGGKLAIVLDIDETSLSNWPAYKANGWARITNGGCELPAGPCNIRTWQSMGKSQAIKSTLALAQYARAHGVAVFFISGRAPEMREATEANLRAAGFPIDGLFLIPPGRKFASAIDFKTPARKQITDRGYTIILSMGDQWSDLKGGFVERTFKLPNPVYFLP